jgi:hypothetical protein
MKEFLAPLFCFSIFGLFSQNLVPNPSFEQCSKCDSRGFIELYIGSGANDIIDWTAATYGTPDIHSFTPYTGMKHGGFFLGFQKFEYLTTHLDEALKPGFKYRCSFHIRPDTRAPYYAVDQFGVFFQQGLPNYPQASPLSQLKPYFETPDGEHIAADNYKNYSFEFTACGGEDHILFGLFHPLTGNDTLFIGKTRQFPQTSIPIYYLIDDVSLELIEKNNSDQYPNEINYCEGQNIKIVPIDSFDYDDIIWSTGDKTRSIEVKGLDSVWVKYQIKGTCYSIIEGIKLNKIKPEILSISGDTSFCQGMGTILTAQCNTCTDFLWSTNESSKSILVKSSGAYTVKADWECGELNSEISVKEIEPVRVSISLSGDICDPNGIQLKAGFNQNSPCGQLVWNTGDTGEIIIVKIPGTYSVTTNCICGNASTSILVKACEGQIIKFPNSFFSKSENQENRSFKPFIQSGYEGFIEKYSLKVYNRWGKKVFETKDYTHAFIPEESAPSQTFVFIAELEFKTATGIPNQKIKGDVSFIK